MTGNCETCGHWVVRRKTVYGDGTEIVTWDAPASKGRCEVLDIDTVAAFGCTSHEAGDHVVVTRKDGAPWQHWRTGPCPDCGGNGTITHGVSGGSLNYSVCGRCVGTGSVRHHDDGHVGENRHRRHPKEPAACTPTVDLGTILQPESNPPEGRRRPPPEGII